MKKIVFLLPCLFFNILFSESSTYSSDRLDAFYNEYISEEKEILLNAGFKESANDNDHPNPPIPPPLITGYFAIQLINTTGLSDDRLFVIVKGQHTVTVQSYILFGSNGKGTYADVSDTSQPFSPNYCKKFSELPGHNHNRYIYVPQPLTSARVYFSIDYPLYMSNVKNVHNLWTIVDPAAFNLNDPNYYTFFDKLEFSYGVPAALPNANLYVDPTAVDYFSLPISIQLINPLSSLSQSGLPIARATVFNSVQNIFNTYDKTSGHVWSKLFLTYVANPFNDPTVLANLRIVSPRSSINNTAGLSANPNHAFPNDYLVNSATYGFDYVNDIWNFYDDAGTNRLRIDANEIQSGPPTDDYRYVGSVIGGVFTFNSVSGGGPTPTWTMQKPTGPIYSTFPFFAGAGFNDDGEVNNTAGAIIVRQFTAAFDVGILPINFTAGNYMTQAYFISQKNLNKYYTINTEWGAPGANNGPFYDLYSKAIHSFSHPLYSFAYDDELGQDGTLNTNVEQKNSYLIVTLSNVNLPIPNPYNDPTNNYSVEIAYNPGRPVTYRNSTSGPFLSLTNPQTITNITSNSTKPLQIKVAPGNEIYTIYLKYGIVIPPTPDFTTALGIVITQTGATSFHIATPG